MPVNLCEKYPVYHAEKTQRITILMSHEERTKKVTKK